MSRLRGDAYVLVRAFLLRVHELEPTARRERAASLAERVAATIDVPLHPGTDPEAFLVAVAAAHQARLGDRGIVPTASFVPPPAGMVVPPPVVDVDQPADTWGR